MVKKKIFRALETDNKGKQLIKKCWSFKIA